MTWPSWRLVLASVSCVLLAWNLQRALTGITFQTPAEVSYTLTAPQDAPRNPAAAAGQIWLRSVYVDGRERALRELERSGEWKDEGLALVHLGGKQPASVRIRGRQVTACFFSTKWAGIVRVEGASGLARDVDLFSEASALACVDLADGRVVSQPTTRAGAVVFRTFLALLPVLVVCALWRPWTSAGRLEGWILLHVSVLHAVVWLTLAIGYNSDGIGYAEGFPAFRSGLATAFPPGYTLFVTVWGSIVPGLAGSTVAAAQHVFMVLTLFALQRMTRAIMPADLASLGFLVAGSVAPTLFLPQTILSENVALFGMAGALWLASQRKPSGSVWRDLGAGMLVSIATLTRVIPLAAVAIPLVMIYAVEHGFTRRVLARTARVLLVAVVVPILVSVRFWQQSGSFALTTSTGFHVYNRIVTEQLLLDRQGEATRRFLGIVGERALRGVPHWEISRELGKNGFTYVQAEQLLGAVALEGLRTSPFSFAVHSVVMTCREYAANPMSHVPLAGGDPLRIPIFEDEPFLGLRSSAIFWRDDLDDMFAVVWRLAKWAPLAGLLLLPLLPPASRLTFLALLSVPAGYLFVGSLVEFFLERYVVAVMPFILVLTPTPAAALLARSSSRPVNQLAASSVQ